MMLLVSSLLEIGTQEEKGLEELQEWNGESSDYTYRISKCVLESFWNSFLLKIITPKNAKLTKFTNLLLCGPFVTGCRIKGVTFKIKTAAEFSISDVIFWHT